MSPKLISRLWGATGFFILLLLGLTITLTIQANNQSVIGVEAKISNNNPSFYLRDEPDGGGQILRAVRPGTAILIIDTTTRGTTTWYEIEVNEVIGWVPEVAVNIVAPVATEQTP